MAWLAGALGSAGSAVGTAAGTAATTLGTLATKAGGAIATGAKAAGQAIGSEGSKLLGSMPKPTLSLRPTTQAASGLLGPGMQKILSNAQTTVNPAATEVPSGLLTGLVTPSTPTQVSGYPKPSGLWSNPLVHGLLDYASNRITGGMIGVDSKGGITLDPGKFGNFLQQRAAIRRQRQAQM